MAVGDDFQSIYSFSGTDISLFIKFRRYFRNGKILKLRKTFRNPKDVVDISYRFVLSNRGQIRKRLISTNYIDNSIIVVYADNPLKAFKIISKDLDNILILSRNKKDILNILDDEINLENNKIIYNNKNIKYLMIHSSKGLEGDYVFILNCIDDVLGFPNKIRENELFKYIKDSNNNLDEERRLFYVALTRCKKRVYIFTQKERESIFVKELIKKYKRKINCMLID